MLTMPSQSVLNQQFRAQPPPLFSEGFGKQDTHPEYLNPKSILLERFAPLQSIKVLAHQDGV